MDQITSRLRSVNPAVWPIFISIFGVLVILVGVGVWIRNQSSVDVEVISATPTASAQLVADVQGSVVKPGVYTLASDSRVKDALIAAGGLADNADREWVAKTLNLAQKVTDGIKIYIPNKDSKPAVNSSVLGTKSTMLNINNCSLNDLDNLPGIGATRAQAIVDGRPYTTIEELVSKKILPQSVFEKIKDSISIY